MITQILIDASGPTGVYYDEGGHPMPGSAQVRAPAFQDRVVAEARAMLSAVPVAILAYVAVQQFPLTAPSPWA